MPKQTNTTIWCVNDKGDTVPAHSPSSQYRNRAYEDYLQACDMDRIEDALTCPISFDVFKDPVIAPCGHTFEKSAIDTVISSGQPNPFTREPLSRVELRKNNEIKEIARIYRSGNTPLMIAIQLGKEDHAKKLIEKGGNIE